VLCIWTTEGGGGEEEEDAIKANITCKWVKQARELGCKGSREQGSKEGRMYRRMGRTLLLHWL